MSITVRFQSWAKNCLICQLHWEGKNKENGAGNRSFESTLSNNKTVYQGSFATKWPYLWCETYFLFSKGKCWNFFLSSGKKWTLIFFYFRKTKGGGTRGTWNGLKNYIRHYQSTLHSSDYFKRYKWQKHSTISSKEMKDHIGPIAKQIWFYPSWTFGAFRININKVWRMYNWKVSSQYGQ